MYENIQRNNNSTEDTESPILANDQKIKNNLEVQTLYSLLNPPFNQAVSFSSINKRQNILDPNFNWLSVASDYISSSQLIQCQNIQLDQLYLLNQNQQPQFRFEFIDVENIQSEVSCDLDENQVVRHFHTILDNTQDQNARPQGVKIQEKFLCDQQIFRRIRRDGTIQLYWVIHNVGNSDFFNRKYEPNFIKHYIESGLFESSDGMFWKLRLQPGEISNPPSDRPTQSIICLAAFPNRKEKQIGAYNRQLDVDFKVLNINSSLNFICLKDWKRTFYVQNSLEDGIQCNTARFYQFLMPNEMEKLGLFKQIVIKIEIENKVQNGNNKFRGLVNEGMTCYLNSLLQTMFFIKAFRNAIFQIPTLNESDEKQDSNTKGIHIVKCLQRIFFQLEQIEEKPVRTQQLLKAFGWNNNEQNNQQDVNEFNCILSDLLEKQMEKTNLKGTYSSLFEGVLENVVQCTDIDFSSTREEKFSTIQLNVKDNKTIYDCFKEYISEETLEGMNRYETLNNGKQNAKKFIRFKKLPPVLQITLNRYEFDPDQNQLVKNNQQLFFQDILELGVILKNEKNQDPKVQQEENRYHLHSILIHRGTLNSGHYYAFIRPNIDDIWYEFNDEKVEEVQKTYAFSQGIGGIDTNFDIQKIQGKDYNLIETFEQSNINAYMLIYVREDEREQIMMDQIQPSIKSQIHDKFKIEFLIKKTINYDIMKLERHKTVYLLSHEILSKQIWTGANICNHQDFFNKEEFGSIFESDEFQRMRIIVDDRMTINQFIIYIKEKYFKNCDNVSYEDIWIYRIEFQKSKNKDVDQFFEKIEYNIDKNYDIKLFASKNGQSKLGKGKSKQNKNQTQKFYIYIAINPSKLDQENNNPYQIFQMLDQTEIDQQKQHFRQFYENSNFNDIVSENQWDLEQCQQIYQSYANNLYKFKIQGRKQDVQMIDDQQIVEMNDFNNFYNEIKEYRDAFTFLYEKSIVDIEVSMREIYIQNFNNQLFQEFNLDSQIQYENINEKKQLKEIMIILKVADLKNKKIFYQDTIFCNRMEPLNLNKVAQAYKIQEKYLLDMDYYLFLEPSSNQSIKSKILKFYSLQLYQENRFIFPYSNVQNLHEFGINCKQSNKFFIVNIQIDKFLAQLYEFFDQANDGVTLVLIRPDELDQENQLERFDGVSDKLQDLDYQFKQFEILYDHLNKQSYVKAFVSQIESIQSTERMFKLIGNILLNYNDTYEEVSQKVYEFCMQKEYDVKSPQHLKFFKSDDQYFVSFEETLEQEFSNNFLSKIIDSNKQISFIALDVNLEEDNNQPELSFLYFESLSMQNYQNKPYLKSKYYRQNQFQLKDFYNYFKIEQNDQQHNSNASFNSLPLLLDRKSKVIIKVLSMENKYVDIVGNLNDARIPFLIRFQDLTPKEKNKLQKNTKNERLIACVQIFDQLRKQRFEQFIVILTCNIHTFENAFDIIKEKLIQIIENEDNPISKMVTNLNKMKLLVVDFKKDKNKIVNFKNQKIISYISMEDENISEQAEELDDNKFQKNDKVSILIDSSQSYHQNYHKEIYGEQIDMQFQDLQQQYKHIYLGVQIEMDVNKSQTDLLSIKKDVTKSQGFIIYNSDDS